jgi:dTDP-4-dehydrorhamnose 3,5-epimerase
VPPIVREVCRRVRRRCENPDMQITHSAIPEVVLIEPKIFQDERGFFLETFQARKYTAAGIPLPMVQDNHSGSRQGVLRGLHYQIHKPQGKLVSVVVGEVFDVAVDLRRSSPTFGRWVGVPLSAKDHRQLWVPPGFAHGFYTVSEWADAVPQGRARTAAVAGGVVRLTRFPTGGCDPRLTSRMHHDSPSLRHSRPPSFSQASRRGGLDRGRPDAGRGRRRNHDNAADDQTRKA